LVDRASPARSLEASDVFVGFLCLYLFTVGFTPPRGDAVPMWDAAINLVRHGTFAIDLRWPNNAPTGRGGHYYPVAALLACLSHVPGAALQLLIGRVAPSAAPGLIVFTSKLGPLVCGALTPTLFFLLLLEQGYQRRQAAWATLMLGTATIIFVYTHHPYSEMVQTVCFLAFFRGLLRAAEQPSPRVFLGLGFAAGLLVNAKNVYFVCLPGAVVYLFVAFRARRDVLWSRHVLWRGLRWGALGLAPGLLAFAAYNQVRWGSIASSGYGAVTVGFWRGNVFFGLWGQLFSPGRSLFLFSPPLVLGIFGARRLVARRPGLALALALLVGPLLVLYARYLFWSGDWCWGPRYLVFAIPVLMIPVAELFDDEHPLRPAARLAVGAVFVGGLAVQTVGTAFYWDDFIAISRQVQYQWLGHPDSSGSPMAPYPCFSCFDELYAVQWLPATQPIEGHWWLLRHRLAGDDWRTAERDAPWSRYTSLTLNIERSYDYAEIDWWPFLAPPGRRLPLVLLVLLVLPVVIPWRPWRTALGRRR
jgi:hypothetical protein